MIRVISKMSDLEDSFSYDLYDGGEPSEDEIEELVPRDDVSNESSEDSVGSQRESKSDDDESISEDIDMKAVSSFIQETIVIKPENRMTTNIMSKFEMTNYIVIRATQISQHANCMVDITGLTDALSMAKRELMMRKCPLTLRRLVGKVKNKKTGEVNQYYEYWDPAEMVFATEYPEVMF